jgi:creatinine amidohydrolase
MKCLLAEISWIEAKEYFSKNDIVILPIGSTEQHGFHNPLGTDHLIAKAIAEEVAERTNVLCLPIVPFGVSSGHKQFWGTIYIQPENFKQYVRDICLSLKFHGARKIVVVNGHGGNTQSLLELARELREEGVFLSVFVWWHASEKLLPTMFTAEERQHASAEETSLNLALHGHLVQMDKAVDEKPKKLPIEGLGISCAFDTVDYTDSGVFGKSSSASAEKGKTVFETVVNELVKHVESMKKVRIEDLLVKPHKS